MRLALVACLLAALGSSSRARAQTPRDGIEPRVLITEPAVLARIEEQGGSLASIAFGAAGPLDNAALSENAAYRGLMQVVASDVHALAARDPLAGVTVKGHPHRLFDERFLRAASAGFELVAVANRMDRQFFNPGACGELRLVYRLRYRKGELASRLPMTVALEMRADRAEQPGDCRAAAAGWRAPARLSGGGLAAFLARGPLAPAQLTRARILQVVTNVQTVRWPSAVRPDLGGHAEYVLRAFAWDEQHAAFSARKLENTPDVARLRRDSALRGKLLAFVRAPASVPAIDSANVRIPDEFLAESVVSVTPRGLSRRANRPFRTLFTPAELATAELAKTQFARSPEAFVRRLDDLTCNGCHQSRSIAGFHLLGDDLLGQSPGNELFTGTSPHTRAETERRIAVVQALADGNAPELARPLAERVRMRDAGYGAHCGLGDPGFAAWTCADGLHCDPFEANVGEQTVGVCVPDRPSTGDICEPNRVEAHADPLRDRARREAARACPEICEATRVGFPGGMCAGSCDALPREATCGGIAVLTPFNECLAHARPFSECVRDHVRPAALRACSETAPCRDDYVCARTASGAGACLPPYFVFQLRVDGHPAP